MGSIKIINVKDEGGIITYTLSLKKKKKSYIIGNLSVDYFDNVSNFHVQYKRDGMDINKKLEILKDWAYDRVLGGIEDAPVFIRVSIFNKDSKKFNTEYIPIKDWHKKDSGE